MTEQSSTRERPTFGTTRFPAEGPKRLLVTPKQLPVLGIAYNINHLRRMWQRGEFPTPIQLSPHRIAWRLEAIEKWIAEREADRSD